MNYVLAMPIQEGRASERGRRSEEGVNALPFNEARCRELVENSIGLVTALSPVLGYEACTELAREALEKGSRVYDLVIARQLLSLPEGG